MKTHSYLEPRAFLKHFAQLGVCDAGISIDSSATSCRR